MSGVILASAHGEAVAFLVIGILGSLLSAGVFLVPGAFDAATRMRLRMQGLPDDDERRRFIATVLGVGSLAMLATALTRL
jgi:hypothetical protein